MNKKQKKLLTRIIISGLMILGLAFVEVAGLLQFGLYLIAYLIIGYDILRKAWKGILNKRVFDENFLMAVVTIGAMALGLIQGGDYVEAIAVMLFYQIGELFQSYAVGKSRKNITELMDIRPDYANVLIDDKIERVDPDEVAVGSFIIVNPGEKVPIDGVIEQGNSSLNQSALTGESVPVEVVAGDEIISGCINMTGVLKIRTTKDFGESTVCKIMELVENASSAKSKSENFIARFAKVYTPIVCYSAIVVAFLPPLVSTLILSADANLGTWIYRALSFLVASCPCALVISIPLCFFAGLGGASKQGILIKGSNYLEALSKTSHVVFDKTGTVTLGIFEVNAVHHNKMTEERLIEYAAMAECASSHPIAKSIMRAYGKEIDHTRVSEIEEISGNGVSARVDGELVLAGNDKLMEKQGIAYRPCHHVGTIIHVAIDGEYQGHIVISDMIKPTSKSAIDNLRKLGIKTIAMLTGDASKVADDVANVIGIKNEDVYSELLPEDKVLKVEEMIATKHNKTKVAFVGEGINDAPVLARADIGVAMGAMGSDAAIEAADIVLMDDDPLKIALAIKISKKCLRLVYQNIVFAIGIKLLALVLITIGIASMWMAIFADVGVTILAILNASRALFLGNIKI